MSITSSGYDGSVNEANWAGLSNLVGTDYAVAGDGDWKVTIGGTGTRPVTVAAGTAFGSGVKDVNSGNINDTPAAISSGTRWDTVVIARDWSSNTTSVAIRTGTATKQVTRTNTTPGVLDDQPIALILLDSSLSAVQQVVDLRSQTGKIHTVATAVAVPMLPVQLGAWAYALDSDHLWHGELVSASPAWVDVQAPAWQNLTLGSGLVASGQAPQVCKIGGIAYLRGGFAKSSGNFTGTTISLATLPVGFRPGASMSFEVDHNRVLGTAVEVRVAIGTTGAMSGVPSDQCSSIRLDGISFPAEN